jgi:hypothetical protein
VAAEAVVDVPAAAAAVAGNRAVGAAAVAAVAGNPAGSLLSGIHNEGRPPTSLVVRLGMVARARPSFEAEMPP